MNGNDCRNRGFILDGFPLHYEDARFIFYDLKKKIKRKKKRVKKVKKIEEPPKEDV